MRIELQERSSIHEVITIMCSSLFLRPKHWKSWILEKLRAWRMTKERSKKEVIREAQKEQRTVDFATLMDICHLKNAELESKFQK